MMNFKTITLETADNVCTLTLNQAELMNALTSELVSEIGKAVDIVKDDNDCRVLVITGDKRVFAAGGDIKAMANCDPWEAQEYIAPIHKIFNEIAELPKPTIAAISGFIFGGGVELSLTCDFRIAAENAKFGFPEITLGIFPAAGGSQRLPRLIGITKTKELMFTGDTIDAGKALSLGLVNKVVPVEDLKDEVNALARKLCNNAPMALSKLKESIHLGMNSDINTALSIEMDKCCSLFSTGDQKEGMQAFMERRKPQFKGE